MTTKTMLSLGPITNSGTPLDLLQKAINVFAIAKSTKGEILKNHFNNYCLQLVSPEKELTTLKGLNGQEKIHSLIAYEMSATYGINVCRVRRHFEGTVSEYLEFKSSIKGLKQETLYLNSDVSKFKFKELPTEVLERVVNRGKKFTTSELQSFGIKWDEYSESFKQTELALVYTKED